MAIKRRKRLHAEVATSALSDIMFFLLLFFLIISTLANPNVIKVPLPESKANEKTNKQHVTLTVTQDKKYFVDKKEIANLKKLYDEYYTLKIEYASKLYKMTPKDENVMKIETSGDDIKQNLKGKNKELGVVNKKITAFSQEYDMYKMNEKIHRKYQALVIKKKDIIDFIKALESHEYDPKCVYCMKHPVVKQKMEKEKELMNIEKEMKEKEKKP